MEAPNKNKKNPCRDARGQTVVEFILLLSIMVVVVGGLRVGFLRIERFLRQVMVCEVSAACPDCRVEDSLRNRFSPGACRQ